MIQSNDVTALADRIIVFKDDPEKLQQATEFVEHLIKQAEKEVELKLKEKDRKKFEEQEPGVGNIKRRLGRARGFVVRMFDALCNCTQTAAAAAARRNNLFSKR